MKKLIQLNADELENLYLNKYVLIKYNDGSQKRHFVSKIGVDGKDNNLPLGFYVDKSKIFITIFHIQDIVIL